MHFPADLQESNLTTEKTIPIKNGKLKVTKIFTYLGVTISNSNKDDKEVKKPIQKATSQIGALKLFLKNKNISVQAKQRVFLAIPISTLLWGSEAWTLTENIIRMLRVFMHKSIRWILNVNMYEVQEHKITNQMIRTQFYNTPDIVQIIQKRQTNWISAIAKMSYDRLPRKLLASWVQEPRKIGRPQASFRDSFKKCITPWSWAEY